MSRLTKLRRFRRLTIAYEVQKNLASRARGRRRALRAITPHDSDPGDPESRIAYSASVFAGYLGHGRLGPGDLEGARVLEVGPGEDLSVALRFLAAGAASVTCTDRFEFDVDPAWERAVYRLLLEELDDDGRRRLSGVVAADGELDRSSGRLDVLRGVGIEEAAEALRGARFDLIVSVAVLEHVYDLEASMRAMDSLLAPGGRMIHFADLRDHGMFSGAGRHPLEFLTIGERVYRLMTSHTGAPNRERVGTYRRLLAALGHEADLLVTNVGGSPRDLEPYAREVVTRRDVDPATIESAERLRPRMAPRFASLSAEELVVTGILIRSRKPARGAAGPS